MANKKSSVKKTTTKTKKVTSSAKNNAELYENSNSNLIVNHLALKYKACFNTGSIL